MTTATVRPGEVRAHAGRVDDPDPEVPERAKRRTYTARYKLEILAEYEGLDRDGKGALLEAIGQTGERHGHVGRIARQLDIGAETLRTWVRQAEIDGGARPGLTTEERARLKELERENRELRRANEILRSAAAFFGAELDRRQVR